MTRIRVCAFWARDFRFFFRPLFGVGDLGNLPSAIPRDRREIANAPAKPVPNAVLGFACDSRPMGDRDLQNDRTTKMRQDW